MLFTADEVWIWWAFYHFADLWGCREHSSDLNSVSLHHSRHLSLVISRAAGFLKDNVDYGKVKVMV